MRICITLDDVIRAKTKQFGVIYNKYINRELDLSSLDMSSGDLMRIFKFKDEKSFNKFLYEDYVFDIFGKADVTSKMIDKNFNLWLLKISDDDDLEDEDIEFIISNPREFNLSIGCTHFFLSKMATRVRETFFPTDSLTIWDKCDVLITADKKLLENKPAGKKSVKIITDYNKECESDIEYNSLQELIDDEEFFKNIK